MLDNLKSEIEVTDKLKDKLKNLIKVEMDNNFSMRTKCFKMDLNNQQNFTLLKNNTNLSSRECQIFDDDRRFKLKFEALTYPYSAIGLIKAEFEGYENKCQYGTGTLIADNIVITCAHNFYNNDYKIGKVTFSLGWHNNNCQYVSEVDKNRIFISKNFFYDPEFSKEDYAIFVLEDNPGKKYGYMGLAIDYELEKNKNYYLYGFPLDNCNIEKDLKKPKKFIFDLWGMKSDCNDKERYLKIQDNMLYYTAFDTYPGNSGSAIYVEEDNKTTFIYCIHTDGTLRTMDENIKKFKSKLEIESNKGLLITKSRFDLIVDWIIESKIDTSFLKYETFLDLSFMKFRNLDLELLKSSNLKYLTHLILSNCKLQEEGLKFFENSNLNNLLVLDLSTNCIECIESLSRFKLERLKELNLFWNDINAESFEFLEQNGCPFFKTLEVLKLRSNNLENEGVKYLKNFENLKFLDLSENNITELGVKYLSEGKFTKISVLDLSMNDIGAKGADYLKTCKFAKELKTLLLAETCIEDDGLISISNSFPNLSNLNLYNNMISEKGLNCLPKSNFKNLTTLDLWSNFVEDTGIEIICKNIPTLTNIKLEDNNITKKGIEILIENGFKELENLIFVK